MSEWSMKNIWINLPVVVGCSKQFCEYVIYLPSYRLLICRSFHGSRTIHASKTNRESNILDLAFSRQLRSFSRLLRGLKTSPAASLYHKTSRKSVRRDDIARHSAQTRLFHISSLYTTLYAAGTVIRYVSIVEWDTWYRYICERFSRDGILCELNFNNNGALLPRNYVGIMHLYLELFEIDRKLERVVYYELETRIHFSCC